MTRALGPGHSEIATPASATEHLFSYGTLQLEAVQLSTFGRRLAGHADQLPGYRLAMIEIRDAAIVATSGQPGSGMRQWRHGWPGARDRLRDHARPAGA